MTNDNAKLNEKKINKEEEKILFGQKMTTCFACGAEIKEGEKTCPNCKTKQSLK